MIVGTSAVPIEPALRHLRLTIGEECAPCLLNISASVDGGSKYNPVVFKKRPGVFLRALSIFILLVKYAGKGRANPAGWLEFTLETDPSATTVADKKNNWINTIADGFAQNHTIGDFFGGDLAATRFIMWRKDTFKHKEVKEKKPALVRFNVHQLLPEQIHIFKPQSPSSEGEEAGEIESIDEILKLARTLESHESADDWAKVVGGIVKKLSPLPPNQSVEAAAGNGTPGDPPFELFEQWQKLGKKAKEEMTTQADRRNWYVISVRPLWIKSWMGMIQEEVAKKGSSLKFACHSPQAANGCISVRAQWNMNLYHDKESGRVKKMKDSLKAGWVELKNWASELHASSRRVGSPRGTVELYKSLITHPFMAIMSVPAASATASKTKRTAGPRQAPPGTLCFLGFYPFYPRSLEDRCALYLKQKSPVLDVYYDSILRFFELGEDDGYLIPVFPPRTAPRRPRRSGRKPPNSK